MTFTLFKQKHQKRIFFLFASILPLAANCTMHEDMGEKHIGVAMRMIGHEVLMCLGDQESRIMPIEKIGEQYKIPFEFEFGFDPDDIVSIVNRVMTESEVAAGYLVEVEQCDTKEIVHSFEIGNPSNPDLIPCRGRILPEDCYSLLITILEDTNPAANLPASTAESISGNTASPAEEFSPGGLSFTSREKKNATLINSALIIIPLVFLTGFVGYFKRKKKSVSRDPNVILIGASTFDKRDMVLSFNTRRVELSHKEGELLSLLHTSANALVTREFILHKVWGDEGDYVGRTVDVFISKLRRKLEADASVKIVNIRGIGYKLVMDTRK